MTTVPSICRAAALIGGEPEGKQPANEGERVIKSGFFATGAPSSADPADQFLFLTPSWRTRRSELRSLPQSP